MKKVLVDKHHSAMKTAFLKLGIDAPDVVVRSFTDLENVFIEGVGIPRAQTSDWMRARRLACHDVANRIAGGDTVNLIVPDGPGSYRYADKVRVKPGQRRAAISGSPDMFALPE
ncbi:hypothetical protein NTJ56_07350 [Burkholderia contaminans]|uniref:hypothetical protein n=1 Tax=Burkholderia contaminans TaxID=488447 RepID=UPI001CF2E501|nr:hypothetical protein [Burkholderia contaminans]MCA7918789.1 hypothetical protein [Burkholderia contaminans]UUX38615.1 hypothetical protein NTJ56_07350 [Burkholderia contaminans]